MNLTPEDLDRVQTKADFVAFMNTVLDDLTARPEQWENADLRSYLEAIRAWVHDMDGYYIGRGEPVPDPDWRTLAHILAAARIHE
ncbi:MAG TPA: hypothetical protein VFS20_04600 [Longimicrobium sp.]|nr:hypothetical protein [Longimicrobium sp.]